ncbi:MAG: hypothetical protein U0271_34475 [Polyangiaceae bacterium]
MSGTQTSSATPPSSSRSIELVRKTLAQQEHGAEIEVTTEGVPALPLPGLELYKAWPLIPDAMATACFVKGDEVGCGGADAGLGRIVELYGLAASPEKLSDGEWIGLVLFTYSAHVVRTAGEAKQSLSKLPDDKAKLVSAPALARSKGALEVTYYTQIIANDVGPIGLAKCTVSIPASGAPSNRCDELFKSF